MTTLSERLADPKNDLHTLMFELRACGHRDNQPARSLFMLAKMERLIAKAGDYVAEALDAHEHSDGRELLTEIDALLGRAGRLIAKD